MKAKLSNLIALDLGSSKIAGIAAYVDKQGESTILSQTLHCSEGIKSGIITNLKAAENTIISSIYALEKECDKNIKQVSVSLSGFGTKSYYINNKIKLSNNQITREDVKKLIQKVLAEFKIKDQEIIHCFPIEFTLDNNSSIDDPVGMFGKELWCQLHIVTVNTNLMTNLINCFAKCQIEITNVVLAIYASSLACLSQDEKNLGSIIIDVGARTTSFGIFLSSKLIYTGYIEMGGAHITSDIAKIFSVNFDTAEKLKVIYGNAMISNFDKDKPINIYDLDPDNIYNSSLIITSTQLAEVVNSRIEEILLLVKEQYDKTTLDHLIAKRLIITGGGSMLRGIKELASKIFEKQVRIGKPNMLAGFAEDYNPAAYSTVIGIVKNHSIKQKKHSFEVGAVDENNSWLKKAVSWLKENI